MTIRNGRAVLGAVGMALVAMTARDARATGPAVIDADVTRYLGEARSSQGVLAYAALRELWRRWDQTDPAQIEAALDALEHDPQSTPPIRAYAGMVSAYARRRRGDLEGAHRKVKSLGFVEQWLVVGPFDNEAKASLMTPFGPEEDLASPVVLGKSYEGKERPVHWRAIPDVFRYGWVDLGNVLRPAEKVCGYATTFVRAKGDGKHPAAERPATVWAGASGAFRVFWNAEEVLVDTAYRAIDADRFAARVTVKPGWNRLTVKVCGDEEGPMLQIRLADEKGLVDPDLETRPDVALAEEASKNAVTRAAPRVHEGKGVHVVAKGDPYAKGAAQAVATMRAAPPPIGGALAGLAKVLEDKRAPADTLEAYARYLALTGGDEKGQHNARDLASRAAEIAPTTARLLLAADLSEDRNLRASWVKRARAGVRPGEDDTRVTLAEAMLARGGTNFRDATPFFDKLLAKDPNHLAGILGRAELFEEAGLRYSALATLEDAAARLPNSVAVLRALAHQYRAVGRTREAEDVEARSAHLEFDDVPFLRNRIELAVARRDVAEGTRWIERLLLLDPDAFTTVEFSARAFRALGQDARAFAILDKRLELAPEDVDAMRVLADLYGEGGKPEEQMKLLRRILVLRPQAKDVREYVEHAQPPKIRRDEAFAWDKDQLLALAKEPSPGGFLKRTLRDLRVTTVYANGLSSHFHQVAFQPLTEEGAAAARQYAFAFQAGREVVDVRAARVYRKNGQVDEAIETGDGPADNPSIAMYTSTRTFYVQLPRLAPGDVVELRYRVEEVTPRNEFGESFSETEYLQSLEPSSSQEYVLLTPKDKKIQVRFPRLDVFTTEEKEEADFRVLRVLGKNVPPITPEPTMPPLGEGVASVSATTFSSWDEVGKWYWGLSKDQFDADDEVRRKVKEITKGLTTDVEKIRAVYDFVVQRTRYVALEFGIEGFRPRRCAQTLGRGWGDCKDKATVIVTMLRELGIPANVVLVRTQLRGNADTDAPSYSFFDHAIAYVPKLDVFLDGTAEYTGMNELPPFDRGANALITGDGVARLVKLPEPVADQTVRSRHVEVTVPDQGAAQIDLRLETTGAIAAEWRQRFHALATQKGRIVEDLGGEFGGFSVTEKGIEVNDLENIEQPVKLHVRAKALGLLRPASGDMSFVAGPSANLTGRYASLSSRRLDVKLPFAYGFDDEWTVRLPAGAQWKHLPDEKSVTGKFGALEVKVERQKDRVVVRSRLRIEKTRIAPAEYAQFRTFCEDVDRALADRVAIGK